MRNLYAGLAAFAIVAAVLAFPYLALPSAKATPAPMSPVVKLFNSGGHGTAVHIGDGYALTAAHVVGDKTSMQVKASDGSVTDAEVLWVNKATDVALVRLKVPKGIAAAKLSCRTLAFGEEVRAEGNPVNLEFVSTWGKVSGKAREMGPWRNVTPLSITIVPGMSGGALWDARGYLVGINVATAAVPMGFTASFVAVGYAVDGATICGLLARS